MGRARSADAAAHAQVVAGKSLDLDQLVFQVFGTWAAVLTAGDLSVASARVLLELAEREGSAANLGLAHVSQFTTRGLALVRESNSLFELAAYFEGLRSPCEFFWICF